MARTLVLSFAPLLALVQLATAQVAPYGQCGGQGYTGATACRSGYVCTVLNPWFSQCLVGTTTTSVTDYPPTTPISTITVTAPGSTAYTTTTTTVVTTIYPPCPTYSQPVTTVTVCPGTTTTSTSTTTSTPTPTGTATGLHALAKRAGLAYFGTAVDNNVLSDAPYMAIFNNVNEFGMVTPGNAQKWDATEPQRGSFQFARANEIIQIAEANGQQLRGHTCVWHSQLPSWVSSGGFDAATLTEIVATHCKTVVAQWKGKILADSWDVTNEIFNEDGTWRPSVFSNTLNSTFVATALRAAREADPATKLYVNDYNIDGTGAKSTAYINLVRDLKAQGVPVDGIGLQGHLIVGSVPNTIQQNIEAMVALGVEVAITELDIRMTLPVTDAKLQQQKADYQKVITACKNVPKCIGVTIWDFTDKYSWVPSVFDGEGAPLPWDENFVKKPAYDGIVAGLGF